MNEAGMNRLKLLGKRYAEARLAEGAPPGTMKNIKEGMDYFLAFMGGRDEESVVLVTPETLHAYQMRLYGEPGKRGKPLCLMTQSSRLSMVRMFFRWLVRRGHIPGDPAAALVMPKFQPGLPRGVMTRRARGPHTELGG
jgi:site-specific recombinase XerD